MSKLKMKSLNPQQRKAVLYAGGPLLVVAGAGSGKTRVLTYRVAHMIKERGILPSRLFVTTFTNKAADEMTERLLSMVGIQKVERLRIGTFHSLCYKILKDVRYHLYKKRDAPKLIMGGGRWMIMQMILNSNGFKGMNVKEVLRDISYWKNQGLRPEDIRADLKSPIIPPELVAYECYEQKLAEDDRIDFDDMLFKTYWLLMDPASREFLKGVQKRIDHLLIDEGQDLNPIQFMLTRILMDKRNEVTVVLDDWQTLYGFRGATVKSVHRFMEEYKPHMIKLEQNYRSTKTIVETSNKLIKVNLDQIPKTLFTENNKGDAIEVMVSTDPDDEAQRVLDKIEELVAVDGFSLCDIAILYRTNAQSRAMVDRLVISNIPHKVFANYGFYDRAEVKDLIAYLRIVLNPYNAEIDDFKRVINKPTRYLGAKFIDHVEELQLENEKESFWEGFKFFDEVPRLSFQQKRNAEEFLNMVTRLNDWVHADKIKPSTGKIINRIIKETKYDDWLKKEDQEDDQPDESKELNLESFMAGADRFPNPELFLRFVDSIGDIYEDEDDFISLMTVHKSKGTEYPVVFVIGVSEGLLPHPKALDLEEERRICYVALTRARERLQISLIHGKYNRRNVYASRFIKEMGFDIKQILGHEHIGYVDPCATMEQIEMFSAPKTTVLRNRDGVQALIETMRPTPGSEAERLLELEEDQDSEDRSWVEHADKVVEITGNDPAVKGLVDGLKRKAGMSV